MHIVSKWPPRQLLSLFLSGGLSPSIDSSGPSTDAIRCMLSNIFSLLPSDIFPPVLLVFFAVALGYIFAVAFGSKGPMESV